MLSKMGGLIGVITQAGGERERERERRRGELILKSQQTEGVRSGGGGGGGGDGGRGQGPGVGGAGAANWTEPLLLRLLHLERSHLGWRSSDRGRDSPKTPANTV